MSLEVSNITPIQNNSPNSNTETNLLLKYNATLSEPQQDTFDKSELSNPKKRYIIGGLVALAVVALALKGKVKNIFTKNHSTPAAPKNVSPPPQTPQTPTPPTNKPAQTPKSPAKTDLPTPKIEPEKLTALHIPAEFANAKISDEEFFRKMDVLRKQMIEYYKSTGNKEKVEELEKLILRPAKGSPQNTFGRLEILDTLYSQLRIASYTAEETIVSKNIDKLTSSTNIYIKKVVNDTGHHWNYRYPINKNIPVNHRYSLNAKADEKLINALDKFMSENQIKGYYKTPTEAGSWCTRHDPITMYLKEPLPSEVEKELERITKPYIRSKENVLIGEKVADGLTKDFEPTQEQTMALYETIKQINPRMAKYLTCNESHFRSPRSSWSAGQLRNVIEYIKFMISKDDYNLVEIAKVK